jgi:hypothetical protein
MEPTRKTVLGEMKQHERTPMVNKARGDVIDAFMKLEKNHSLKTYEGLLLLLGDRLGAITSGFHHRKTVEKALEEQPSYEIKRNEKLRAALWDWRDDLIRLQQLHDLTYGEWFSVLGGEIAGLAKYLIRTERHPNDPDKGGDIA